MIEFNVNHYVYVKLTEVGKQELKRQHEELDSHMPGFIGPYKEYAEDAEGWSKWQMHSLMNHFGHMMTLGSKVPFETTIRIETVES